MENRSSWKDDQNRLEILILYLNRSLNIFVFRKLRVSSNNPVFINQPHKKLTRSKSAVLQNYEPPTNSKPKREKIPEHMKYSINIVAKSCAQKAKDILVTQRTLNSLLTHTLSAWPLRSHWALKSISRKTVFLDQLHEFSLLSLNSFLHRFLISKFT